MNWRALLTFQSSAFFVTYSQHAWLGALLTLFALHLLPWPLVLFGGATLASVKEFGFDRYLQQPHESLVSAWTGVKGYLYGIVVGASLWGVLALAGRT